MLSQVADQLVAVIEVAEPVLRSLQDEHLSVRPSPDRWTIKEVVGHLVDSAANNHQRFVRAQFMNPLIFPKYDQNEWVRTQQYCCANWSKLIDLWSHYNHHLAHVIRSVSPVALDIECRIGDYAPVTLQFLINDYVIHLKHHLRQIALRLDMNPTEMGA